MYDCAIRYLRYFNKQGVISLKSHFNKEGMVSLVPRVPRSGMGTLKLCRCKEPVFFYHSAEGREALIVHGHTKDSEQKKE